MYVAGFSVTQYQIRCSSLTLSGICVQNCQCLPGLQIASAEPAEGLSRIQCVAIKYRNVTAIIVFVVLGTAFLVAVAAVTALVIKHNRHALGPPGGASTAATLHACLDVALTSHVRN